jgi:crotonobetainyl-CoA:carnitine CoA-transferase CaiB-like acyl-CoA transferase
LATGANPKRLGNDHPSIAPYGPVTTSDGLLLLAVGTDQQFVRLVKLIGDERLSRGEWATNDERVAARDDLRSTLNAIFVERSSEHWLGVLNGSGVPHAPVLDVAGAFAQEQIRDGDFVGEMSSPGGPLATMRTPLLIDGVRPAIRRGPRRQGEDTDSIFGA